MNMISKKHRAAATGLLFAAGIVLLQPSALSAKRFQTPPWKGSFSFGSGLFYPAQTAVRTLYGDFSVPFHVQADVRLGGPFAAFAGYRYLATAGATVLVDPSFEEESAGLTLLVHSLRAGFRLDSSLGRSKIFAQIGGAYHFYRERWDDRDLAVDGRIGGAFLAAGVEIPLGPRWALQLRGEYISVPTDKGGPLEPSVDLGGLDAVLGIVYRFGRRQ